MLTLMRPNPESLFLSWQSVIAQSRQVAMDHAQNVKVLSAVSAKANEVLSAVNSLYTKAAMAGKSPDQQQARFPLSVENKVKGFFKHYAVTIPGLCGPENNYELDMSMAYKLPEAARMLGTVQKITQGLSDQLGTTSKRLQWSSQRYMQQASECSSASTQIYMLQAQQIKRWLKFV